MPTPAVQTALTALDLAQAGHFTDLRELFMPSLHDMVTVEVLQASWEAVIAQQGPVTEVRAPLSESAGAGSVVRIPVSCDHGGFTLIASTNEAGQLGGLQFAPPSAAQPMAAWTPPDYVDQGRFDEQEVTLGSGPLAVPGTISVPHGPGARPGVVLLAGSGPLDRDETIGRNKPLKDIAWGLATRGIVVLRFDKVTYAHAHEFRNAHDFTLDDEYLTQAAGAIHVLREHPGVDARRVFVLGHSLGGTVAPRVAAAEPLIAGLVILAGGAQPLHWSIVRQTRYLASLNPQTEHASQPAIDALSEKARMVDSPDLSPSTPTRDLPFGTPASYWLDLRGYNPAELAATLHKPMLILQGGRDYQSTVDDDLARWKAALDGRPEVTIRVYPHRNHLFTSGTGPLSPIEYEPLQHVDPEVITDIVDWLGTIENPRVR